MKTLYLIRHAKSSKEDATLRDFDRPLNNRGHNDAEFMAAHLKFLNVQPDLIICSPAKRTLSTAEQFALALQYPLGKIQQELSIYEATPSELYEVIHQIGDSNKIVLLIGHNPSISLFTNGYTKEISTLVPTCSVVHFKSEAETWSKFNPENATFVNLVNPSDLI